MDVVFQYEIPVLHPLVVHFPIALILVGTLTMGVWGVRGTAFWRRCALWLFALGVGSGIAAYRTGGAIAEQSEGTPIVEELAGLHEDLAFYALLVAGATLIALAGVSWWLERRTTIERNARDPLAARVALGLAAGAAAVLIALTAHLGGTMVWGTVG